MDVRILRCKFLHFPSENPHGRSFDNADADDAAKELLFFRELHFRLVRELVVFAAIAALGGCESQLKAHTGANLKEGNTKQNLADALQIAIPLNGFPRTLNALAVVNSFK
ncbi:carboxymuconolactone decarboxylase family protein [Parasutterella muris]|uniref:carboxymuconolactone decarboxylase family protein n=1 Tax=Parasutterella muris TaxID=2565572 RepID=UPI00258ACB97|nr:carboxymuconolactone decarboxylase family protein [uncultured Parasutterella sp.]